MPRSAPASGPASPGLANALLRLAAVWTCLLLAGEAPAGGEGAAVQAGSFVLATLLAVNPRRAHRGVPASTLLWSACAALGFAGFAAWVAGIGGLGLALGLRPPPPSLPWTGDVSHWSRVLLLAPLWEEHLYRGRLLPALQRHLGVWPAVLLASLAFALPHATAWSWLGCFCVGIALGALRCASGSVGACVAYHAGLNLASLACGAPPGRCALPG